MIDGYLHQSKVLRLVFLLVDIRHKPNQNDIQMYEWCVNYGFNPIIIATKSDKIKRSQLQKTDQADQRCTAGSRWNAGYSVFCVE